MERPEASPVPARRDQPWDSSLAHPKQEKILTTKETKEMPDRRAGGVNPLILRSGVTIDDEKIQEKRIEENDAALCP